MIIRNIFLTTLLLILACITFFVKSATENLLTQELYIESQIKTEKKTINMLNVELALILTKNNIKALSDKHLTLQVIEPNRFLDANYLNKSKINRNVFTPVEDEKGKKLISKLMPRMRGHKWIYKNPIHTEVHSASIDK